MDDNSDQAINKVQFIKELEAHCKSCKKASEYAIARFDILIIALSSGALAFSAGFIKDLGRVADKQDYLEIKVSWALFGAAIIFNLFSQITSYYSNKAEIKIVGSLLKKERCKKPLPNEAGLERQKSYYNFGTDLFNGFSLFAFIIGIAFLITFMFTHF